MKLGIKLIQSSGISQIKPGDTVTGRIIITPTTCVKIRKLILFCDASEECSWTEENGSDTSYCNITRQFMDQTTYLIDEPDGLEIREETSYSFSVTIPKYAPPSFSLLDGGIKILYFLTARLIKDGFNKTKNLVLNVTAPVPVIDGYSSGSGTNKGYEKTKKYYPLVGLFRAQPPFEAHVNWKDTKVDHKDYCAPISVECVNRMKSPVTCDVRFEWNVKHRAFHDSYNRINSKFSPYGSQVFTEGLRVDKNFHSREYLIDFDKGSFVFKRKNSIEIPAKTTKCAVFEFKSCALSSVIATDYDVPPWKDVYTQHFFKPITFKTVPTVHISVRKAKKSFQAKFGKFTFHFFDESPFRPRCSM